MGGGSDEISNVGHAYLGPGDERCSPSTASSSSEIIELSNGAKPVGVAESEFERPTSMQILPRHAEDEDFLARQPEQSDGYIPSLRRGQHGCTRGLPPHALLVLDAAYCEYVQRNDYERGWSSPPTPTTGDDTHVLEAPWLGRVAGGLGLLPRSRGRRAECVRGPFNVWRRRWPPAPRRRLQGDEEASVQHNEKGMPRLAAAIASDGPPATPSVGNFFLANFAKSEANGAEAADKFLKDRGIIVRKVAGYGLPECLRITIGTEDDNKAVVSAPPTSSEGVSHDPANFRTSCPDRHRPDRLVDQPRHAAQWAAEEIVGSARTKATLDTALKLGLIHKGYDTAAEAAQGADLVFLSVPVGACGPLAAEIAPHRVLAPS